MYQSQGSAAASEMEIEKLKRDCQKSVQMVNKWRKNVWKLASILREGDARWKWEIRHVLVRHVFKSSGVP
jgi:hypothetical protein